MKDELNEKIFNDLLLTTDDETISTLNDFKDGISIIKSDWKDNTYAIGIRFKNIDVYKYYYGISENTNVEIQTEEHFFYNKVYPAKAVAALIDTKGYDLSVTPA